MKKVKIINRGKITYYIYEDKVIVNVGGGQWVSYNQYDNWNRQGIAQFSKTVLKSRENEYDNVVDQITLAVRCGIKGTSTRKPEEAE